jgi:hypothetical protein
MTEFGRRSTKDGHSTGQRDHRAWGQAMMRGKTTAEVLQCGCLRGGCQKNGNCRDMAAMSPAGL